MRVSILGSGSWGTALSLALADNGHEVVIYGVEEDVINDINTNHRNKRYLGDNPLPLNIVGTLNIKEAVKGMDFILFAVPTNVVRLVAREVNQHLDGPKIFIHVSKGIEPETSKRISEMLHEELTEEYVKDVVVLSGPSHAEEVVLRHLTTVTAACENLDSAVSVQSLFSNHYLRVYTNQDVIGVELGGALKNIIALAVGVIHGVGHRDNAKAALMTRGLAEISRLGVTLGAKPRTFSGLSGLGDLIVTCTSEHSRNFRAGNFLGQGHHLDEVLENMGMVVEGVRTTKAVHKLAQKEGVEMPITAMLYKLLFEDADAKDCVDRLMARDLKDEEEEMEIASL